MRAGPVGREDALACEAELACLPAETGHPQQLQERAREASEAFAAASARVKSLHRDWRAAGLEVARLAEELAEAEAAQAAAQVDLEAAQAEAAQAVGPPVFTPQDAAVLGALRDLAVTSGMPVQELMEALQRAVAERNADWGAEAAAAAAGSGAAPGPGGGFGGRAVVGALPYDPESVGPTPTSPAFLRPGTAR